MPEAPKRVVVTGIGAITAAGWAASDLWQALLESRRATTPLQHLETAKPAFAGQIAEFEAAKIFVLALSYREC